MTMPIKINDTARSYIFTASDQELLDELDVLVANAARGDRDAVGAIAIAFGPTLLKVAHEELGPVHAKEAGDVFQDLCLHLLEGDLLFPGIRGGGLPWLKRMVRALARAHLRGGGPDWDLAG